MYFIWLVWVFWDPYWSCRASKGPRTTPFFCFCRLQGCFRYPIIKDLQQRLFKADPTLTQGKNGYFRHMTWQCWKLTRHLTDMTQHFKSKKPLSSLESSFTQQMGAPKKYTGPLNTHSKLYYRERQREKEREGEKERERERYREREKLCVCENI